MPTYEYQCSKCGHRWEKFQSITAAPIRVCPTCGKRTAQRLIGIGAGVIFKGSGFYQTDYRSEAYKEKAKSESESAKPAAEKTAAATGDAASKPDAGKPAAEKPADAPASKASPGTPGSAVPPKSTREAGSGATADRSSSAKRRK